MAERMYVCYMCKQKFKKGDMVEYCPVGNKNSHRYCLSCFHIKKEKEFFEQEICKIFGLKAPGPKIYSQRKILNEKGFTDEVIIYTLKYMFEVLHMNKKFESLGLVNRENAIKAKEYYLKKEKELKEIENNLTKAKAVPIYITRKEKENHLRKEYNLDDFLEDEE